MRSPRGSGRHQGPLSDRLYEDNPTYVDPVGGFGGQMIYIVKDLDLVVVMTTNTRDFTQDTFDGVPVMRTEILPSAG